MAYQPTADWALVYSGPPGRQVVDISFVPNRDIRLVRGPAKLAQDIILWLQTPRGARFTDPTYGNALYGVLGQAIAADLSVYSEMVLSAEAAFLAQQARAAASGFLALDEQLASIDGTNVTRTGPAAITVSFTIHTRAETVLSVATTLPALAA